MILRSYREKLDAWLHKHEVDVCRLFAVYFLVSAAMGVCGNVIRCIYAYTYISGFRLDIGFIVSFIFGVAFWLHKSWVRTLTLVFAWFIVLVTLVLAPSFFFIVTAFDFFDSTWCTIGGMKLQDPPTWISAMVLVYWALFGTVCLFAMCLLTTQKIRKEIAMANAEDVTLPVSPLNLRLRWMVVAVVVGVSVIGWILLLGGGLKKYEVDTRTQVVDVPRMVKSDDINKYYVYNKSLIVVPVDAYQRRSRGSSASDKEYFITFEGYPELHVKPRTKYTLVDGEIHAEPWRDTGEWE